MFQALVSAVRNVASAANERVVERLLLKADDFREAQAGQELHVEDFLDGGLEFQEIDHLAATQVHCGDAALQFAP